MISISLYTNTSPENFVTKSKTQIGAALDGVLRDESEILRPVVRVESASDLSACNYVYIPAFNRYYFAEVSVLRTNLWEISCRVDVLASFSTALRACSGITRRAESENAYNVFLDDGSFRAYSDPHIITQEFPNGFTTWEYLLAVAGGSETP